MKVHDLLFGATTSYAGLMLWITPHLPMVDLPQHAGQIALMHGLFEGNSRWSSMLEINPFTPYLIPMGLVFMISCLIPTAKAFTLLLMISLYLFVAAFRLLRKDFNADERLDWLALLGYFGFSFQYGFFTFLVSAPLGFLLILVGSRHMRTPSFRLGASVAVIEAILLCSHGLMFGFSNLILLGFLAREYTNLKGLVARSAPLMPFAFMALSYLITSRTEGLSNERLEGRIVWNYGIDRLNFLTFIWGLEGGTYSAIMNTGSLAAPLIIGSRLNRQDVRCWIPWLSCIAVGLLMPSNAFNTAFLYERFALFFLPFYGMLFLRRDDSAPIRKNKYHLLSWKNIYLPLLCWTLLLVQTERLFGFKRESDEFNTLLSAMVPEQRVLSLIFYPDSIASGNPLAYLHYPLWYQVHKKGFVDFNFAFFAQDIVRFRHGYDYPTTIAPPLDANIPIDWVKIHGDRYRYYIARHNQPLDESFFTNNRCKIRLIDISGHWSLYESNFCGANTVRPQHMNPTFETKT